MQLQDFVKREKELVKDIESDYKKASQLIEAENFDASRIKECCQSIKN